MLTLAPDAQARHERILEVQRLRRVLASLDIAAFRIFADGLRPSRRSPTTFASTSRADGLGR